jgi:hypothetical protein
MDETEKDVAPQRRRKKTWSKYVFEFIMVFLAVFFGFMAENFREEMQEERYSQELAKSFYQELILDSTRLHDVLTRRPENEKAIRLLKNYIIDKDLSKPDLEYVRSFTKGIMERSWFVPSEVIFNQLKASGAIRYFRSEKLKELTNRLSIAINSARTRNDLELRFMEDHLIPFVNEHNDQKFFDLLLGDDQSRMQDVIASMTVQEYSALPKPYVISNLQQMNRLKAYNMLGIHANITLTTTRVYLNYQKLNNELLSELRKEYGIKLK